MAMSATAAPVEKMAFRMLFASWSLVLTTPTPLVCAHERKCHQESEQQR